MRMISIAPHRTAVILLAAAVVLAGCRLAPPHPGDAEAGVRAVLDRQVRAWNTGDLASFMETYEHSGNTRFASGGEVYLGWETVYGRYRKRYGDRQAMGTLHFSEIQVEILGPDAALAFGRWRLDRGTDAPSGLFTLILRRTAALWRIVHDHTSEGS